MKKLVIILFIIGISITACNDSLLEKYPLTSLTEENAFQTYENFSYFIWPMYEMFSNNTIGTSINSFGDNSIYRGDFYAGFLGRKNSQNPYAAQSIATASSGNGWDFKYIRRINIMLSNLDKGKLTEAEAKHLKAVGYFFHSYWYMELIDRFGDVPWINTVMDDSSEDAYAERMPRKQVADSVLNRLLWAEQNINLDGDGHNTINKDVVRATISRFTLREATWRKYHNLGDAEKYFQECAKFSQLLIEKHPNLYYGTDRNDSGELVPAAGYGELWNTRDLKGIPGILLYKQHIFPLNLSRFSDYEHIAAHTTEMPQLTVDLYLCKDGRPISTSQLYQGDKDPYTTFRNRDPRLYHVVMPPFKVLRASASGGYFGETTPADKNWKFTDNPIEREYIDIMGANHYQSVPTPSLGAGGLLSRGMKRLPTQNWSNSPMNEAPHLNSAQRGNGPFQTSNTGYYFWKCYNNWEMNSGASNTNDADMPLFRIEEILLNYAECMYEQGQFDQAIADITINKLRHRAGVANMVVNEINGGFDLNRGTDDDGNLIHPVLWEIRRERSIELMGEGFGFYDVRRWKSAKWYVNRQQFGMWIKDSDYLNAYSVIDGMGAAPRKDGNPGYIFRYPDPVTSGAGWLDKYYLYCVPTDEIVLNPKLEQNPGW